LIAEVLSENMAMLKVFKKSDLQSTAKPEAGIMHVTLQLLLREFDRERLDSGG
jgi:hypothetical protein